MHCATATDPRLGRCWRQHLVLTWHPHARGPLPRRHALRARVRRDEGAAGHPLQVTWSPVARTRCELPPAAPPAPPRPRTGRSVGSANSSQAPRGSLLGKVDSRCDSVGSSALGRGLQGWSGGDWINPRGQSQPGNPSCVVPRHTPAWLAKAVNKMSFHDLPIFHV